MSSSSASGRVSGATTAPKSERRALTRAPGVATAAVEPGPITELRNFRSDPTGASNRLTRPEPDSQAGYFITVFFTHSVETDFGRTMGEPIPLLRMACAQMPIALETLKSTV